MPVSPSPVHSPTPEGEIGRASSETSTVASRDPPQGVPALEDLEEADASPSAIDGFEGVRDIDGPVLARPDSEAPPSEVFQPGDDVPLRSPTPVPSHIDIKAARAHLQCTTAAEAIASQALAAFLRHLLVCVDRAVTTGLYKHSRWLALRLSANLSPEWSLLRPEKQTVHDLERIVPRSAAVAQGCAEPWDRAFRTLLSKDAAAFRLLAASLHSDPDPPEAPFGQDAPQLPYIIPGSLLPFPGTLGFRRMLDVQELRRSEAFVRNVSPSEAAEHRCLKFWLSRLRVLADLVSADRDSKKADDLFAVLLHWQRPECKAGLGPLQRRPFDLRTVVSEPAAQKKGYQDLWEGVATTLASLEELFKQKVQRIADSSSRASTPATSAPREQPPPLASSSHLGSKRAASEEAEQPKAKRAVRSGNVAREDGDAPRVVEARTTGQSPVPSSGVALGSVAEPQEDQVQSTERPWPRVRSGPPRSR